MEATTVIALATGGLTPSSVAVMMARGWLAPGWLVRKLESELLFARTENKELAAKMIDTAIPAVTHSALVLESLTPLIAEAARNRNPPHVP